MLVVIHPLAFVFGLVFRITVSSVSMTDVLIPISMVLGPVAPGTSASPNTHALTIYFSNVLSLIFFDEGFLLRRLIVGRVRVLGAHLDVVRGELHLCHESRLLGVSHQSNGLVGHHIGRFIGLELLKVLTDWNTHRNRTFAFILDCKTYSDILKVSTLI
jgi:hypothetical protein